MSYWTKVSGIIEVEVPFESWNENLVKDYINWSIAEVERRCTKVTGSEGKLNYYVNVKKDYYTLVTDEKQYYKAVITVCKGLRDREGPSTYAEVKKFIKRLNNFMTIDDINLFVEGTRTWKIDVPPYDDMLNNASEKQINTFYNIIQSNYTRFADRLIDKLKCK